MLDEIYQAFDLMDKGKLDEAMILLERLSVDETSPAYYNYLSTYAYVYTAKQAYNQAIACYNNYLNKALQEEDALHQHRAHHQLCMVYREQGNYKLAQKHLELERVIIEQYFAEEDLIWAVHLYEVAYLHHLLGEHQQAISIMQTSLERSLKTDDLIAQACAYRGLGELLSDPDHLRKARSLFEQAGDIIGGQEIDRLLANL